MCSGVRSCADGSDEHVDVCGPNCEGITSPGGGWACKNGECIRDAVFNAVVRFHRSGFGFGQPWYFIVKQRRLAAEIVY